MDEIFWAAFAGTLTAVACAGSAFGVLVYLATRGEETVCAIEYVRDSSGMPVGARKVELKVLDADADSGSHAPAD
ncbi:hypothetical protein BN2497_10471 [Janthinobacterium sp. CG23_2]|nr:hypothetical protein BN2497_10471 [Janthinobacterium sp. CG23_2]CUU31633.1 hypothetical protein BN3177_10471 [Janthinobacterium sp. CG23_2]